MLKRRSISSSVINPFFGLMVVLRGLLLMVLLSLAELFFQSALELIALRICETSVVRVAIGTPSLFFLRLTWFYLCIYSITTIIILLIYPHPLPDTHPPLTAKTTLPILSPLHPIHSCPLKYCQLINTSFMLHKGQLEIDRV